MANVPAPTLTCHFCKRSNGQTSRIDGDWVDTPEGMAHEECHRVDLLFGISQGEREKKARQRIAAELGHKADWLGNSVWVCSCWLEGRKEKNWLKHVDWVVATA